MQSCLIGHTGFVGSTLLGQTRFDDLYHSKNIADIRGKQYDLVVCAGAPAVKWYANQHPAEDLANLQGLMDHLEHVSARRFVLISTVDVYRVPQGVDEDAGPDAEGLDPYGRHRFYLEEFVRTRFAHHHVVRLPGLFGPGLKKNFVFDLLQNPGALHLTHADSQFQFYDMDHLWADLQTTVAADLRTVNFAVEPVRAGDVAATCFGVDFTNRPEKPPVFYDMRTRHGLVFGQPAPYLATQDEVLAGIARLARRWGSNE